jgi:polygalacturonase
MTDSNISRRRFLQQGSGLLLAAPFGAELLRDGNWLNADAATADFGWARVPGIERRIIAPRFPSRVFDITKYGATAGGEHDASIAIRRAIVACSKAGGGRVLVPAGVYATGPVHLESRVELHLHDDATLRFSTDPKAYLPAVFTRWEGVELMGYSPLIYAYGKTDIAVTGKGVLDGAANATNWWPWKGNKDFGWRTGDPDQRVARAKLFADAEAGVPVRRRVYATESMLRPQFIQPYACRNVLIADVTIRNSPMWEIHPVRCTNVTVRDVKISSHGPNNDGCDPESCRDVLISGCDFDTGDDCIAIKSGRNADGRRLALPTENVIIRDCRMRDGHGGVTIGSEISGSVRGVYAERCNMDSPNLDRALRLKTNAMRGGVLEHIYMRDVTVGQVADAVVHVDFTYEEGAAGRFMPTVRDIEVLRVKSTKGRQALMLRGFEKAPISNVRVIDCDFDGIEKPDVLEHVNGLVRTNVRVNGKAVS